MMTNKEAINLLRGLEQSLDGYCELNDDGKKAFNMAVSALELFGNSEQLPSAQPESCGDAISREYLKEHIEACWINGRPRHAPELSELLSWIDDVPSAQPERKKGCKIVKGTGHYGYCACDQCGKPVHSEDRFCPNCGADFRKENT